MSSAHIRVSVGSVVGRRGLRRPGHLWGSKGHGHERADLRECKAALLCRTRWLLLCLVVLCVLGLASCGAGSNDPSGQQSMAAAGMAFKDYWNGYYTAQSTSPETPSAVETFLKELQSYRWPQKVGPSIRQLEAVLEMPGLTGADATQIGVDLDVIAVEKALGIPWSGPGSR